MAEGSENGKLLIAVAVSSIVSGGGAHVATKSNEGALVESATIEQCLHFMRTARELERLQCNIEKNELKILCSK